MVRTCEIGNSVPSRGGAGCDAVDSDLVVGVRGRVFQRPGVAVERRLEFPDLAVLDGRGLWRQGLRSYLEGRRVAGLGVFGWHCERQGDRAAARGGEVKQVPVLR